MKLLLFEIEKTSIEVEALRSEKEQTKKLAKKTYKKRLQGLASLQADSQVYIATKQKLENEMRETENAKEKLQHISAELKRKSSEVTRNKERVKKAQKSLDQWYKYESQIQEKNREIEPDGKLISMAEKELLRFQKIFKGNFYVELQYHGMEDEAYVMPILAELAYRNGVSVVATNDVHIIRPEDAEGRSYLKSLRFEKFEPVTDSDRELYLKSDTELSQKLCEIIPENIVKSAIANIRVICDNTQKEQWAVSCNMVEAEEIGLLKMDFLALKNLDIISESIRRIKKNYGIEIDPEKLPFEDEVFSHIFAEGRTSFIFQFESDGMKKMLREFKPDSFEDLILLVAAYRPGPMDFIPDIIAAKHGKKETHYIIPQLKEILGTTYGQCIYQEQLMSIFHECAGFSLGQADIIRRYMSKKKVDKFLKYKSQLCAQLRVCNQVGGNPIYPRSSQPDNSESWDVVGNSN